VLRADPDALREALDALLENAVKYTEPGAEIELTSRAQGTTLVIGVRDTGQGIGDDATERIFARSAARTGRARGRRAASGSVSRSSTRSRGARRQMQSPDIARRLDVFAHIARLHGSHVGFVAADPGPAFGAESA
jgi:hypothetical protein